MSRDVLKVGAASFGAVVAGGVAVGVGLLAMGGNGEPNLPSDMPLTDTETYGFMEMPDFELVDQRGRLVTRDDVIGGGKWTVLDFMFTNCVLACPIMSGNMRLVNQEVGSDRVRFVSISVDPENDTVRTLRSFGERLEADDRWRFLKTEPGDPERIVGGLGLLLEEDTNPENTITLMDGGTMENIIHPTRFLVFNPEGVLVGSYRGMDRGDVEQLIRDLSRVLAAGL